MKICLVGCGYLADCAHGPSLSKYVGVHHDAVLAGCCDNDFSKAQEYKEKFGFHNAYTDINEMLDSEKPDAVFLVVPVHLIAKMAVDVMKKGIAVMMEKPPGASAFEALEIRKAFLETNRIHQVAFNRRHMPLLKELKGKMAETGAIHHIIYDLYRVDRCDENFATTAVHAVDTVKYLVKSNYKEIQVQYTDIVHNNLPVTNIMMNCRFENGITAQINIFPVCGIVAERATVLGEDNTFYLKLPVWGAYDSPGILEHMYKSKLIYQRTGDYESMFESNGFYDEDTVFLDCIKNNVMPADTIDTAIQTVEIMELIEKRQNSHSW